MFGVVNYGAFIIAGVLLNLTPGVDTIYILTKSVAGGRSHGFASALGISTGCLVHTVLAALGLSLVLLASAELFFVVKLCGAVYLIVMGVSAIYKRNAFVLPNANALVANARKVYAQGIITNVLNPKVALFFLAFLPQFVDPSSSFGPLPFFILGLTFVLTGTIWCLAIAYGASYFHKLLQRNNRIAAIANTTAGGIYILLGITVLITR